MSTVNYVLEALQFADGDNGQLFDQSKRDHAAQPHEIEQILPDAGDGSRLLDILMSKGYENCVNKLASYLKIPLAEVYQKYPDMYSFTGLITGSLTRVMGIEAQHKQQLERLAIQVVLDLPEFALFKELYEQGHIKIDAQIALGDLSESISVEQIADEQEQLVEELAAQIEVDPEKKLKRAFHNYITQGNALHKSFLFNMANEELEKISPTLPAQYGLIMAATHVLYYGSPYVNNPMGAGAQALGSEQVDGDTIIVRGVTFPVLVHEIVKGLFDYLGQDISPETHGQETIEDEYSQLMAGPALFQKLFSQIPQDKIKLFPIIYRLLMQRTAEDIKTVIAGGPEGKRIIDYLAMEAARKHEEQNTVDEPEVTFDEPDLDFGGYGNDGGDEFGGDGEEWKNN